MRSWNAWLLPLGLAGLSLVFAGCGGSNATDSESDANAANEPPAAAPAEAPAPVAAAPDPAAAPAAAEAAAAPAGDAAATEEAKPKDSSAATAEMLALGNKPAGGTAGLEGGAAAPGDPAAAAAGGQAAQPGLDPTAAAAAPGAAGPGAMPGAPGLTDPAGGPAGVPGAPAPGGADPGAPALVAAPGGEPAAPGDQADAAGPDPGNSGGNIGGGNFKEDFHTPFGAVTLFLKALRAKDAEKLMKATALRAPRESSGKNQSLFTKILEQSMTEDDLSELANKYEGYRISGNNTPKSTGRFTIILNKRGKKGETYVRTITTRHEKEGWKVVDLGGEGKIPAMMRFPTRGGTRRR